MDSARFGLPGDKERILGIEASHSDICRFDPRKSQKDRDNLDRVLSNVDDLFELALARSESMTLPNVSIDPLHSRLRALRE